VGIRGDFGPTTPKPVEPRWLRSIRSKRAALLGIGTWEVAGGGDQAESGGHGGGEARPSREQATEGVVFRAPAAVVERTVGNIEGFL
jgi:hypothetical protein